MAISKKEIFELLETISGKTSDPEEQKYLLMDLILHYFSKSGDFINVIVDICKEFNMDLPPTIKTLLDEQQKAEQVRDDAAKQQADMIKKQIEELEKIQKATKKQDTWLPKPWETDKKWVPYNPYNPNIVPYYGDPNDKGIYRYTPNPNDDRWDENGPTYRVTCETDEQISKKFTKFNQFVNENLKSIKHP